jgi:hypothetical protein
MTDGRTRRWNDYWVREMSYVQSSAGKISYTQDRRSRTGPGAQNYVSSLNARSYTLDAQRPSPVLEKRRLHVARVGLLSTSVTRRRLSVLRRLEIS